MVALEETYALDLNSILATEILGRKVSSFTPAEFRYGIAMQVAAERSDLAQALDSAGLALYPESEDVLSVCALLAELRQDWSEAVELLETLIKVQGDSSMAISWQFLIRCHRCNCDPANALAAANKAMLKFPGNEEIHDEYAGLLRRYPDNQFAPVASTTQ